jgi:hypothetical protein
MRRNFIFCGLFLFLVISCGSDSVRLTARPLLQNNTLPGRWQVRFVLSGIGEKNLIFEAQPHGAGQIQLKDTGPENQPVPDKIPGTWSALDGNRVNMSGEVELPIGTCCRETGTLILKGKFARANSISGKAIFVGSSQDEENLLGYRIAVGTFVATPER